MANIYDPLLCVLDKMKRVTGYELVSEKIYDIRKQLQIKSIWYNAVAFMDDTTLIGRDKKAIEQLLEICHSFYKMTDIVANKKKYEIIKINSKENA